jgi:glutamyl-tRNA synthetase
MTVRVRFPPSPTGNLHVGGVRTALFNWLFVRKHGGIFVLRIEDTDKDRSNPEHNATILESLRWLGLNWDEGPYFQSESLKRHKEEVMSLLDRGLAYRDFSSAEELASERTRTKVNGPDRRAARRRAELVSVKEGEAKAQDGESHAIRFRVPEGQTIWKDMVHGEMKFENADIDDLVILRSDGSPTYNFAVASDDANQGITHVIRGDDHLSNTAKQILIYNSMEWMEPVFAHVPMILGPDGKRLSKRHGATAIQAYRDEGFLPSAMINFLALLGWNPGDDIEFMDLDTLIDRFSMDRVLKKSSIFDLKKLGWLSGQHFNSTPAKELAELLSPKLEAAGLITQDALKMREDWYLGLIDLLKTRARRISDLVELSEPFFSNDIEFDESAVLKHWLKDPEKSLMILSFLRSVFTEVDWDDTELESKIRAYAVQKQWKLGEVIHPLRGAITGREASPGIFDVLIFLGRDCVLDRLGNALDHLEKKTAETLG